jgi:putative intracellular protease/amidase
MDKSAIKILKENKAIFKEDLAISDENIITAKGPEAINDFAKEIIDKLNKIDIIQT